MLKLPVPPIINGDTSVAEQIKGLQSYLTNLVTALQPLLDTLETGKGDVAYSGVTDVTVKDNHLLIHKPHSTTYLENAAKTDFVSKILTHTNSPIPKIVAKDLNDNPLATQTIQTIYPVVSNITKKNNTISYTNVTGENSTQGDNFIIPYADWSRSVDNDFYVKFHMNDNGRVFSIVGMYTEIARSTEESAGVYTGYKDVSFYGNPFTKLPFVTAVPYASMPHKSYSVTIDNISSSKVRIRTAGSTNNTVGVYILAFGN